MLGPLSERILSQFSWVSLMKTNSKICVCHLILWCYIILGHISRVNSSHQTMFYFDRIQTYRSLFSSARHLELYPVKEVSNWWSHTLFYDDLTYSGYGIFSFFSFLTFYSSQSYASHRIPNCSPSCVRLFQAVDRLLRMQWQEEQTCVGRAGASRLQRFFAVVGDA